MHSHTHLAAWGPIYIIKCVIFIAQRERKKGVFTDLQQFIAAASNQGVLKA